MAWERLTNPSLDVGGTASTGYYPDGLPRSRHTYNYVDYIPSIDRFCSFGVSSPYPVGGGDIPNVDCFNFQTLQWERKANTPSYGIGAITAHNPVTNKSWVHGTGDSSRMRLAEYNPQTNTWAQRSGSDSGWQYAYDSTAAIDTKRNHLYAVGGGKMARWDLNQSGTIVRQNLSTTGDTAMVGKKAPGFAYDPVSDKFVAWSGGADVYRLDPATLVWTRVSPASTNTVIPTMPPSAGTYGRFRYIPSKNAFIVVNSINQNVYFYKLSSGSGTTSPPVTSFDFSLSNGGSKTVTQGQSVSNTVTASLVSGTSQPVSFSTSGMPSGATYSYSQTSCNPSCAITLTIQTYSNTLSGNYPINVTASGGGVTRSTSFTLTVSSPSALPPSGGSTLTVGPGKQYSTIAAAVSAAQTGTVIEIDAGTYAN
jgi:hypothetical protein